MAKQFGWMVAVAACFALANTPQTSVWGQEGADDELVQTVIGFMSDSDKDIRALAFDQVRSSLPGESATRRVAAELPNLSPEAQVLLLSALTDRGDTAARPAIAGLLETNADESVRVAAITALGYLGRTDDLDLLLDRLVNGSPAEQTAAREALVRLPDQTLSPAIAAELTAAAAPVRVVLIEILGDRRAAGTVSSVLPFAVDDDPEVRGAAMQMLGDWAGPHEVPGMLQGVLRAERGRERDSAEKCVMFVCKRIEDKDKQCWPVLIAMRDLDNADRAMLLSTLGRVGGPLALEVVESVLAKENAALHNLGVRALCNWPDASIAPRLMDLAQNDPHPEHRIAALRAVIRVAPLADERTDAERLDLLKRAFERCQRDEERSLVVERAAAVPTVESLRFVLPFVDEVQLRASASYSVCELAHRRDLRDAHIEAFTPALEKVKQTAENPVFRARAEAYLKSETWPGPRR